jgi:hypothetical protein
MADTRTPKEKAYDRWYDAQPVNKKKRAARVKARRMMEREGLVHKGDGKDVDHVKALENGGKSERGNLRVLSAEKNRGWRKGKKGTSYKP